MANSLEAPVALRAFTVLILVYFAFQIYFGLFQAIYFRFGLYSPIIQSIPGIVNQSLGLIADILLVTCGILLFGLSKLNKAHQNKSKSGAVLLAILGIYGLLMGLLADNFLRIYAIEGTSFLFLSSIFSIVSLSLTAVTFLIVGTSILSRRTRPLIYIGVLFLFLFCSFSIAGLISNGLKFVITGLVGSIFLDILKFELNAGWLPSLLFFIAFIFVSKNFKESDTRIREIPAN